MDPHSEKESEGRYSITLQINYEDTDAGGVVYYGNYLAYMERARNAFLRDKGLPLTRVQKEFDLIFVVSEATVKYLSPARLDDDIQVTLEIEKMGAASIWFEHEVRRGADSLVRATIKLATVNSSSYRPFRIPDTLRRKLLR